MKTRANAERWTQVWQAPVTEKSWFQERPELSMRLIRDSGVSRLGHVVDVGGGASTLVDHLLDDGFRHVHVVDIAAAPLRRAQDRLGARSPLVDWEVADVLTWDPGVPIDLWHDRALFHFLVDGADRARYRDVLACSLKQSGRVIIATFADDGPDSCSGLPTQRYDEDGLVEAFAGLLEPVELVREVHRTPAGGEQSFLYGSFRRADRISSARC